MSLLKLCIHVASVRLQKGRVYVSFTVLFKISCFADRIPLLPKCK